MRVLPSFVLTALLNQLFFYNIVVESKSPIIVSLDVKCDDVGIIVRAVFDNPFNGIIFAKGYFNDPSCRFIRRSSALTKYEFVVRYDKCGTQPITRIFTSAHAGYESILVFQNDPIYQDSVRKISCNHQKKTLNKTVDLPLLTVETIKVITFTIENEKMECWMDVQRGTFPGSIPIEGSVQIGETLTVLVYVRKNGGKFDVRVRECFAYDSPQYDNPKNGQLQLTDVNGCPLKISLIEQWNRAINTRTQKDTTLLAYTTVKAFRFPENPDVYLRCSIEICKNKCEHPCPGESNEIKMVPFETINRLVSVKRYPPTSSPPVIQSEPVYRSLVKKPLVPLPSEYKYTPFIEFPRGRTSIPQASSGFRPPVHKPSVRSSFVFPTTTISPEHGAQVPKIHSRVGHRPPHHKPPIG